MEGGEGSLNLLVVPNSGTGGLRGEASIAAGPDEGHSFELDFDLA